LLLALLAFPLSLQVTGELPVFAPDLLTGLFILDAALADLNIANTAHWSGLAIAVITAAVLHRLLPAFQFPERKPVECKL